MIVLRKISTDTGIARAVPLSGVQDGANKVFNTPANYITGSITIDYNGQTFTSGVDFNETAANEITFVYITPYSEDIVRATYDKVR